MQYWCFASNRFLTNMQILLVMILSRLSNTFVFPDPETAFIITYTEDQEYVAIMFVYVYLCIIIIVN